MKVNVFEYMDVQHFLRSVFQHYKSIDSSFSYASWAKTLGFNNKTLLRLILHGKRKISPSSRLKFKNFLSLTELESDYFDALVDYCQAINSNQKKTLGQKLIQLQRHNFVQTQISPDFGILKDAYSPIVLTFISSCEFAPTLLDIEKALALPSERAVSILNNLLEYKLITETNSQYFANQSTFKVADSFGHDGLRNYYTHWLNRSISAIDLPSAIRKFRSVQLLLTAEEYEILNNSFQDFIITTLSRFEKNTVKNRRVYLVNSAVFPITEVL